MTVQKKYITENSALTQELFGAIEDHKRVSIDSERQTGKTRFLAEWVINKLVLTPNQYGVYICKNIITLGIDASRFYALLKETLADITNHSIIRIPYIINEPLAYGNGTRIRLSNGSSVVFLSESVSNSAIDIFRGTNPDFIVWDECYQFQSVDFSISSVLISILDSSESTMFVGVGTLGYAPSKFYKNSLGNYHIKIKTEEQLGKILYL